MADSKAGYTPLPSTSTAPAVVHAGPVVEAVAVPVTDRVEVVAPASLPGNYQLHCDFQGRPVVVLVPPQGVKQGEQFVGTVVRQPPGGSAADGHRIPTGQWRDGCCDCFKHGLCHPMLWLACCFQPLALGQVMTRMKLSATGSVVSNDDGRRNSYWSAFKVLAVAFILYMGLNQILATLVQPYMEEMQTTVDDEGNFQEPDYSSIPTWVWAVLGVQKGVQVVFGFYMLFLLIRTRAHVRHRFEIPETHCRGCEDCCCAFFAPCCTTLQLARHTADYDTYHAACCSETGLPPNAPQVV